MSKGLSTAWPTPSAILVAACFCLYSCSATQSLSPKPDILITNARIIDGLGTTLDSASLVISGGRITSISPGQLNVEASVHLDATGMTVMPGLIDTHCHLLGSSKADSAEALDRWMEENLAALFSDYLGNGFTTIMSVGDYFPAILEVRQRLEDGKIPGPRLLATGRGFTAPDDWPLPIYLHSPWSRAQGMVEVAEPGSARTNVRELASAGVDALKVVIDRKMVPDAVLSDDVLAAIIDEAQAVGVSVFVHAETVDDMLNAVNHGADRLVHTPGTGSIAATEAARLLREESIPISTTVSIFSAEWDEAMGQERTADRAAEHAQILENIRHLWDEGVTVAFGTDSPPGLDFMAEARALSNVLTPEEIIIALTSNAAAFLDLSDEIGTLEAGKIADVLIVDGDPLSDISDLANVEIVIKNGDVVVDNRR